MNNEKVYRATTMREALEKIKHELGESALVLGHQKVRTGGLWGVGTRELIEVRAAANPAASAKKPHQTANKTDSATSQTGSALNGRLAARAYSGVVTNSDTPTRRSTTELPRNIEAAATTPQVALGNRTAPTSRSTIASNNDQTIAHTGSVVGELARLRAELRELKFSISMQDRLPISQTRTSSFDSDPEIYDSPYYEAYLDLVKTGLAPEQSKQAIQLAIKLADRFNGFRNKEQAAHCALSQFLNTRLCFAEDQLAIKPDTPGAPVATVFIGPTGVGKTTTIAKLAAFAALRARQRVELITLDTYRIAAVEQLKTYAELIGAGCHVARSVIELDALTRRFAGQATIFVDTAGRSPHDIADQLELADYLRGACDLLKCLVLQATTHPLDAQIAVKKFSCYGADQLVFTKLDETARPGAVVTIAQDAGLPLVYLCSGQRVPEDLESATATTLTARILRATSLAEAA
ncbi:MAG: flagellar biosynthesis protein FlhF [Acidobacteriota bacterium]